MLEEAIQNIFIGKLISESNQFIYNYIGNYIINEIFFLLI